MIVNGHTLLAYGPIKDMLSYKVKQHGVSHGLGEAGYDIRIKQKILFQPGINTVIVTGTTGVPEHQMGRFTLASAIEEFRMPTDLVGIVHDKSTWARRGLSVFNTVIEPGWHGFLTLELVYHGSEELIIPAGAGIAQVIFHTTVESAQYEGKYQHQADEPTAAKSSSDHHEAVLNVGQAGCGKVVRFCPDCGEPQFPCPSGIVCKNGHGYGE